MPQVKFGTVKSNKMKNTVVVSVNTKIKHPFYKKLINKTAKYKAHYEGELPVGKKVKIIETKPMSKDVHFKVEEVLD